MAPHCPRNDEQTDTTCPTLNWQACAGLGSAVHVDPLRLTQAKQRDSGRMWLTRAACHGPDGGATPDASRLSGRQEDHLHVFAGQRDAGDAVRVDG